MSLYFYFQHKRTISVTFPFILSACAHSITYLPERGGWGASVDQKGGIIYGIPSEGKALLELRIQSLGIHTFHDEKLIGVRMSFAHPVDLTPNDISEKSFYVVTSEETMRIDGGDKLTPSYVNSSAPNQAGIRMIEGTHQTIELLYPISGVTQSPTAFTFQWSIHYGKDKTQQDSVRFYQSFIRQRQGNNLESSDTDYPYSLDSIDTPGWNLIRDGF